MWYIVVIDLLQSAQWMIQSLISKGSGKFKLVPYLYSLFRALSPHQEIGSAIEHT